MNKDHQNMLESLKAAFTKAEELKYEATLEFDNGSNRFIITTKAVRGVSEMELKSTLTLSFYDLEVDELSSNVVQQSYGFKEIDTDV